MTEITRYKAMDGREFEDKEQCLLHEAKLALSKYANQIFLYDIDGEPLSINQRGLERACFMRVTTIEAAQFLTATYDRCYLPWAPSWEYGGTWAKIPDESDAWIPVHKICCVADIAQEVFDL